MDKEQDDKCLAEKLDQDFAEAGKELSKIWKMFEEICGQVASWLQGKK